MAEAFKDADIVYPKSWAPFAAMEKRTNLYAEGDSDGIDALEKELLAQNAEHKDWACTEELMKTTKDGKALYLHCLPADITGVSCEEGEVDGSVFDRYRDSALQRSKLQTVHHRSDDHALQIRKSYRKFLRNWKLRLHQEFSNKYQLYTTPGCI